MKIKRAEKYRNGFTLVELLLGLTIASIVGLCVYNMFWSAMKLDDKMRRVYDSYIAVLMADQALTHDLENAVSLDYTASYPDSKVFEGQKTDFSFLTQTPSGIKRVRYYSGLLESGPVTRSMIGRVVNRSSGNSFNSKGSLPIEFLIRQESSLADWLNETSADTSAQIVAAGVEKGSFNCKYAPFGKDLHKIGSGAIDYTDSWDKKVLPLSVSCSFILYDPQNVQHGLMFKRDIFLAPVPSYYNEQ
jgi:prepilin-type N-terminal cleavage/methylation domain-containing protein